MSLYFRRQKGSGHYGSVRMVYGLYTVSLCPLDRIKVVDTCCDLALLKAAEMLKENPAIFWKWLDWRETGQSLEEKILAVRGVSI